MSRSDQKIGDKQAKVNDDRAIGVDPREEKSENGMDVDAPKSFSLDDLPAPLLASICSYMIRTVADFADLREVSRKFRHEVLSVIPTLFSRNQRLRCCRPFGLGWSSAVIDLVTGDSGSSDLTTGDLWTIEQVTPIFSPPGIEKVESGDDEGEGKESKDVKDDELSEATKEGEESSAMDVDSTPKTTTTKKDEDFDNELDIDPDTVMDENESEDEDDSEEGKWHPTEIEEKDLIDSSKYIRTYDTRLHPHDSSNELFPGCAEMSFLAVRGSGYFRDSYVKRKQANQKDDDDKETKKSPTPLSPSEVALMISRKFHEAKSVEELNQLYEVADGAGLFEPLPEIVDANEEMKMSVTTAAAPSVSSTTDPTTTKTKEEKKEERDANAVIVTLAVPPEMLDPDTLDAIQDMNMEKEKLSSLKEGSKAPLSKDSTIMIPLKVTETTVLEEEGLRFRPMRHQAGRYFAGHLVDVVREKHKTSNATKEEDELDANKWSASRISAIVVRVAMLAVTDSEVISATAGLGDDDGEVESIRSMVFRQTWDLHQNGPVREGVVIVDDIVPQSLRDRLNGLIDGYCENCEIVDYHPKSKGIARDIVHPALFSFVNGVSPVREGVTPSDIPPWKFETEAEDDYYDSEDEDDDTDRRDYWGRYYEKSKYQWLPTYFEVVDDNEGTSRCVIKDYINNLVPRREYEDLYGAIGDLFAHILPFLESVYGYCRDVRPQMRTMYSDYGRRYDYDPRDVTDDMAQTSDPLLVLPLPYKHHSLRGQPLQVVTKIVDYELRDEAFYEGVWHVEGMSHEEIVATALFVLERDEDVVGADILFKRSLHKREAGYVSSCIGQDRSVGAEDFVDAGIIPLGRAATPKGRLLVFPNSHVHRVTEMFRQDLPAQNNAKESSSSLASVSSRRDFAKRRIIVFFLINPRKRIMSTREVPPQQPWADDEDQKDVDSSATGKKREPSAKMSIDEALQHRLELMEERKYRKQDWNVREIELCEH